MKTSKPAIAYGRLSTVDQEKYSRHERQIMEIKSKFKPDYMDFDYDVISGSEGFDKLKTLHSQLFKAAQYNTPLLLEHSDRLLKSWNEQVIKQFNQALKSSNVTIKYAYPNTLWHQRIKNILINDSPRNQRKRSLVRIVDQYLKHRHLVIFPSGNPDNVPPFQSTRILKQLRYYPALTECADHLLELDPPSISPDDFAFTVDAYLGAAYNQKSALNRAGGRIFVPGGQRTYPSCPEHLDLFAVIQHAESQPRYTRLGRPKHVSDQLVADAVNAAGFRNFRGDPFSRKSVWFIRRNPGYRRFCLGDLDLGFLLESPTP